MAEHVAGVSSLAFASPDAYGGGAESRGTSGASQDPSDAGRYRLTIERDATGFVYKTLDRVTGEVIRQLPREEVLKLRQSPAYDVGKVFTTTI